MKVLYGLLVSISVFLTGCSHYYYVADVQNVPLLREKDEFHISGTVGGGDETTCIEVQTAYSVSDRTGVMVNFMNAKGGETSDHDYGKGNYIDAALGYYLPLKEHMVFEVYGGLGTCTQHHNYSINEESDLSFRKLFVQPAFGFTFNFCDVAFSTRLSRISYKNVRNNISVNSNLYEEISELSEKSHYFIEPAGTLRIGWKNLKFQVQIEYSKYLNSPELYFGEELHLTGGLAFVIAKRYEQ